jgi:hypothetical protein
MNAIGEIKFFFNVEMKTEGVNLTHLSSSYAMEIKRNLQEVSSFKNQSLIDMHVVPFGDWTSEQDNYNISKLNFTWNATSFEKNTLIL